MINVLKKARVKKLYTLLSLFMLPLFFALPRTRCSMAATSATTFLFTFTKRRQTSFSIRSSTVYAECQPRRKGCCSHIMQKKVNVPTKTCVVCLRPFTWRKKWERCWDEVTTCSKRCNNERRKNNKSSG
jgi:hypothetical protein